MIDHILGRPSAGWKRSLVLLLTFLSVQAIRKSGFEPPFVALRKWNRWLSRVPPWKIVLGTLTASYVSSHALLLLFLNAPEPLAKMYTRNFYRATWVLTALDAGFFTAMHIRPVFLRDFMSMVRKFRSVATIDIMRASWEKSLNPYLRLLTFADRGFLRIRHDVKIPRPLPPSPTYFSNGTSPRHSRTSLFAGTREELKHATCVILDIPGGGFVAMHRNVMRIYLSTWARQTRVPIVSIDYGRRQPRTLPSSPKRMPSEQIRLFRAESKKDMSMTRGGASFFHSCESPLAVPLPRSINVLKNEVDRREMLRGMALLYSAPLQNPLILIRLPFITREAPDEILARFPRTSSFALVVNGNVSENVRNAIRQTRRTGVTFSTKRVIRCRKPSVHFDGDTSSSPTDSGSEELRIVMTYMDHHVFHRDPDTMVRVKILEGMSHAILQMAAVLPEAKQMATLLSDWALELFEDDESVQQVGLTPGDEAQSLTDYLMKGVTGHGRQPPNHAEGLKVPMQLAPPRSVMGALGGTTSEELLERSALRVSTSGATVVGSRGGSPRMQRARLGVKSGEEKVTEKNFLERRNKALADNYDI
ncbi:hypothetical protein BC829DRAFT_492182 [Chytridium lagenaria]|nr:hypothetical protein BC829DRAFT_492182 [Chytridium lagenaria]